MKKLLLLSVICITLIGCKNFGKKEYVLVIMSQSEYSGITVSEPKTIYAKTDSVAYSLALDEFMVDKIIANSREDDDTFSQYVKHPISFILSDLEGNRIDFPEMKAEREKILDSL